MPEGTSYTEKEYDYALERGVPVLTFIQERDAKISSDNRDDDLTEVNKFIEKVQGKMRDTWSTHDELAAKVTTALYKQFNRTPRPGWVRNDLDLTNLTNEITLRSKENRYLRKKVDYYENLNAERQPYLDVTVFNDEPMVFSFQDIEYPSLKIKNKQLRYEDITPDIKGLVTEDDIDNFNSKYPTDEAIQEYNKLKYTHDMMGKNSFLIPIEIRNNGKKQAKNIHLAISLPQELKWISERDKYDNSEPTNLKIPTNPIDKSKRRSPQSIASQSADFVSAQYDFIEHAEIRELFDVSPGFPDYTASSSWHLLELDVDYLLHTLKYNMDDAYILASKRGRYMMKITIICEEYEKEVVIEKEIIIE